MVTLKDINMCNARIKMKKKKKKCFTYFNVVSLQTKENLKIMTAV